MNEDINREILAELRQLRRNNQFGMWFAVALVVAGVGYVAWSRQEQGRAAQAREAYARAQVPARQPAPDAPEPVWPSIEAALDRGDNPTALSIARRFVTRQPTHHLAHATLGSVYVAMNDFTNAEAAYVRAFELYPVEEYEKSLAAIRKRLARGR